MSNKTKTRKNKSKTLRITSSYDILRVDWKDHATSGAGWMNPKDMKPLNAICTSVGMKVYEDDDTLVLAQNASTLGHLSDTITIIKSCITHREKLAEQRYAEAS